MNQYACHYCRQSSGPGPDLTVCTPRAPCAGKPWALSAGQASMPHI